MTQSTRISVLFTLLISISNAQWNTNDYMKREHSLVKPYQGMKISFLKKQKKLDFSFSKGSGFGVTNWDFLGNTMVTSSHVRLTANEQSQQGAIWNTKVSIFFILTKK